MAPTAVVVGVGEGIGTALFQHFATAGMDTAICTTRTGETDPIAEDLRDAGESARTIECDPRNPVDISQGFADVLEAFGTIDVVTFVAGSAPKGGLFECTRSQFVDALDRDLLGGFCTTRAVVPKMEESGGGTLLYITESTGIEPRRADVGARTAEAGFRGLASAIDEELDDFDVTYISLGEIAAQNQTGNSSSYEETASLCIDLVTGRDGEPLESTYRIDFDGETPHIEAGEMSDR
ncbi:Short-chain alcohol dehydrogenase [Halanaeroarchaeum sp. HSR-CO]|uniref:SDR family NAD(P)-dependent oxidoreductase n=1 Tax=Halanaeroarchaeum sp. HSR-CO TaxID=2866382 RepID=UPI00217DA1A6|nr:SDR family NAD(P)-dependent oxidoreductase [Halanaeroarchaeum sp. HSR-CO]UWG47755.1 Short-chain alcohol dehydrogenase [Halanaeroarchaeum sp. HSR-CO]